jgi:hypothetical protein
MLCAAKPSKHRMVEVMMLKRRLDAANTTDSRSGSGPQIAMLEPRSADTFLPRLSTDDVRLKLLNRPFS